ncbi:hypothetical protein EDM56_15475 [Brevibacillus fluminis]|uniref:Uncharacterized protein n=1 Tax=Brevibacillus fluminis TaxID=511487 RepID=A0A3M8DG86_9BACL|nr:hypothetical protein [Brevibacillus fluminis]RNB87093.1 hypothetical protein EDM56_15475 [Brevibacillus fluminis]
MSIRELVPLADNDILNMPDIQFAAWCHEQYGVNRGIYNTIDQWLFQRGFRQIVLRRKEIIAFLRQVSREKRGKAQSDRIKLGKGVLIPALIAHVERETIAHSG